jgi:hypothetical protein
MRGSIMFTVGGVSKQKGVYKVRFANDLVSRVKNLIKDGQEDINIVNLPNPMEKGEVVAYLMTQDAFMNKPEYRAAIESANAKYNGSKVVRIAGVKVKTTVSTPELVTE